MINKNSFKLSIIVPCYNENNTIDPIIKKIEDSLNVYNYINYEIIIIDDFSTDGTRDKLKKFENN